MFKAAAAHGIKLKMLPALFERRKANQTTITQKSKIMWTIEWVCVLVFLSYIYIYILNREGVGGLKFDAKESRRWRC